MERLGVAFSWRDKSLDDIVTCAKFAEDAGLDSIWISEAWGRDAFLALAAVASATKSVKLAPGIVNVYSRSPALLAMSAASLDEFSNGRAILGLGSSGPAVIERWHGLRYEGPLTRIRETIEIVRQALAGHQVNLQGRIFQVSDFTLAMQAKHRIPIYLAALGPKMLQLAGEIADGVLLYLCPLDRIPDVVAEMRRGADRAKRSPEAVDVAALLITSVSEDRQEARDKAARMIAYYVGGMGTYYHRLVAQSGFTQEADRIREAWQRGDRALASREVSDGLIDSVALAGSSQECRSRLRAFRDAGIRLPILSFYLADSNARSNVYESIKALA